jgi:RNA polymerase sigma factor (sigma-70 family)
VERVAAVPDTMHAAERLTELYEAYAADAFRYALHLTGRREDAEDVVQHVFLQAYAMLESGRGLASPRAWLIKATKHRALNLIRDRHDAPVAEIEQPTRSAALAAEAEALADVRAVLWSLPQPQHHAFVLRHWSGLSQDEIADVLATTPHAVESLLVRARAALVAEREAGDPECAGVRRRLARMREPTRAQSSHVAECRRCRTARSRLLRASGHAAAFALVPGPGVLHGLAASVPGFGASAVGVGGGGAAASAASAASAATKTGIATKIAVAATTAAVAVTAVHPLRSAVTHTILRPAPPPAAASAPAPRTAPPAAAPHPGPSRTRTAAAGRAGHAVGSGRAKAYGKGRGQATAHGKSSIAHGKSGAAHGKSASGHGSSASAHGNSASAHGNSASAPGQTKAPRSNAAAGKGAGEPHPGKGRSHSKGRPEGEG